MNRITNAQNTDVSPAIVKQVLAAGFRYVVNISFKGFTEVGFKKVENTDIDTDINNSETKNDPLQITNFSEDEDNAEDISDDENDTKYIGKNNGDISIDFTKAKFLFE